MPKLSRRVLLLLFVSAGVASGLAAVFFHEWVVISRDLLLDRALHTTGLLRVVLLVGVPAATAAVLGLIVDRFAPTSLGANLSRVRRSYAEDVRHLDVRTIVATFFLTPLSLGSGAPLGPEGPTVVVTSGVSVWIGRAFKLPRKVVRGLVPVGTAAGIAAIFRTPITGVVFALEELFGTSSRSILGGTLVAAVAAAVVQQVTARDNSRILPAAAAGWTSLWELAGFALVGICSGVAAGTMLRVTARLRDRVRVRIPSTPLRFAAGGATVGILGLLNPAMFGVGYETTSLLLRGGGSLSFAAEAFGAKTLGFVAAMSAGLLGGTFAPSLFMGASLGAVVGHATQILTSTPINTGAYALVGMGAYFAGTLRAPIAAVLIVIELTNDYGLILPLMLAVALANTISHAIAPRTLEEDQLKREGFVEPAQSHDPLSSLKASDVMSRTVQTFSMSDSLADVVERTRAVRHSLYPVVDEQQRLLALLSGEEVARAVREERIHATVRDLAMPPLIAAREGEDLHALLGRMAATTIDRCPVVDHAGVVVGFISPSDILRARFRTPAAMDETLR